MMMARKLTGVFAALAAVVSVSHGQAVRFNNPEGVDIWCGKAYRPE